MPDEVARVVKIAIGATDTMAHMRVEALVATADVTNSAIVPKTVDTATPTDLIAEAHR
jgi:hypothetical protein